MLKAVVIDQYFVQRNYLITASELQSATSVVSESYPVTSLMVQLFATLLVYHLELELHGGVSSSGVRIGPHFAYYCNVGTSVPTGNVHRLKKI